MVIGSCKFVAIIIAIPNCYLYRSFINRFILANSGLDCALHYNDENNRIAFFCSTSNILKFVLY